jgi:hypothetical protein
MAAAIVLAAFFAGQSATAAPPEPEKAEYAVRWNPAQGGLATAAEAVAFLGGGDGRSEAWEVRYFDVEPPQGAPPDVTTILRRRMSVGGLGEIRLKYRSVRPLEGPWSCPAGSAFRQSEEVDVGFGGSDAPSRVYSYSCTLDAAEPPGSLSAVPRKCVSRMVRFQAGDRRRGKYKVEAWTLPDGTTRLRFADLVERLRARGVRPVDESKTELGSRCP